MVFQEFGKVHALSSTSIHFLLFSLSNQNQKKKKTVIISVYSTPPTQ